MELQIRLEFGFRVTEGEGNIHKQPACPHDSSGLWVNREFLLQL